jgi:hypothetical protein
LARKPAFFLQAASGIAGPWKTVSGATSPYDATITDPAQFFWLVYTKSP